ncbi:ferritin [Porphyromonadaceae bacterium W3.11]|nr:ferritin [Porphyromonadaceae bacterium W3.11]
MIKKEILKKINEQIKLEYESAFIYKRMSIMLGDMGWPGLSHWMHEQYREEILHAEEMIDYIMSRRETPELGDIRMPELSLKTVLDFFEKSFEHECLVSKKINEIVTATIEQQDYATENFFRKYVNEQVEEEDTVSDLVDQIKRAKDDGGLVIIDGRLGQR